MISVDNSLCFRNHWGIRSGILVLLYTFTFPFGAQTLNIETGNDNIRLAYNKTLKLDNRMPQLLDGGLLYTQQNDHQDLLSGIGYQVLTKKYIGLH